MTWARGVKTILRPLQGVQKRISPFCGGVGSYKTPEKPILTLKIVDSALQEEIMICWLNDMGFKTMLHPLQAWVVQERLLPCLDSTLEGG